MTAQQSNEASIALALGQLQAEVKNVSETSGRMEKKIDGLIGDVSDIKANQAVLRNDVDGLIDREKEYQRRKPPWTAIGALLIAIASFAKDFFSTGA